MEAKAVLKQAMEAVDWAKIPPELREIAFSRAIDLIAEGSPVGGRGRAGLVEGAGASGEAISTTPTESDKLKKIADAIGIPRERIEMLYLEHEDDLQVVVDPGLLGSNMKERSKSIGLLIAAGRQLGGWDEGATPDAAVRSEVDRLGVYDGGNYAKYMKDLNAWFNVNGSGRNATYKLKFQGREYLKTFAKGLAGE